MRHVVGEGLHGGATTQLFGSPKWRYFLSSHTCSVQPAGNASWERPWCVEEMGPGWKCFRARARRLTLGERILCSALSGKGGATRHGVPIVSKPAGRTPASWFCLSVPGEEWRVKAIGSLPSPFCSYSFRILDDLSWVIPKSHTYVSPNLLTTLLGEKYIHFLCRLLPSNVNVTFLKAI